MPSILVTGGASGLGRSIAERFADAGYDVCIVDINAKRGMETEAALQAKGVDAFYMTCDVCSDSDFEAVRDAIAQRWRQLDVLVNNAGVATGGRIESGTMDDWQWVIDINLLGVVRGCRTFTPVMVAQGHGHIVNVASMAGLMSAPLMASYNATKAAVVSLSETLRVELEGDGIATSVVCPSFFQTNLLESSRTESEVMKQNISKLLASSEITAEDIAGEIFRAVNTGAFWVLPHKKGRTAWRIKRYLPDLFVKQLRKQYSRKLRRKAAENA